MPSRPFALRVMPLGCISRNTNLLYRYVAIDRAPWHDAYVSRLLAERSRVYFDANKFLECIQDATDSLKRLGSNPTPLVRPKPSSHSPEWRPSTSASVQHNAVCVLNFQLSATTRRCEGMPGASSRFTRRRTRTTMRHTSLSRSGATSIGARASCREEARIRIRIRIGRRKLRDV